MRPERRISAGADANIASARWPQALEQVIL